MARHRDHLQTEANARPGYLNLRTSVMLCCLVCAFAAAIFSGHRLRLARAVHQATALSDSSQQSAESAANPTPIGRGDILFQLHCAKCHGPEGHGDPEAVATQRPPPRDFRSRPWRFDVSTDSIRRVTAAGIAGTAMPAHRAALGEQDLDAVVAFVYELAMRGPLLATSRSPLETAMVNAGFSYEPAPRDAPDLKLVDAMGKTHSLADERGRIVVLNFWGISCEHCLAAMPKLQSSADRWQAQGLTVLNICADADDVQTAQELVTRVSPTTRVWVDETGLANSQFGVQLLPTVFIVNPNGQLIGSASGMKDWDSAQIERLWEALVDGWPAPAP